MQREHLARRARLGFKPPKFLGKRDIINVRDEGCRCCAPPPVNWMAAAIRIARQRYRAPQWKRIILATCKEFGVSWEAMKGPRRNARLVDARHTAIYIIKETCEAMSFPTIGRLFNVDHTSVMYAVSKFPDRMDADLTLGARVRKLREELDV